MVRRKKKPAIPLVLIVLSLASLLLTACAERTRGLKVALDWSRGVQLGEADMAGGEGSFALAVSPTGDLISLVWPVASENNERALYLLTLNKRGQPLAEQPLNLETFSANGGGRASQLQLAISDEGDNLLLTWIDESENSPGLYHARLTPKGTVLAPPHRLSPEGFGVRSYQAALLADGGFLVMWAHRDGISATRVSLDGAAAPPDALARQGVWQLSFQLDHDGIAHLAWQEGTLPARREIYYATLDVNALAFSAPAHLATERIYDQLHGPVVALEREETDRVYVGWTLATRRVFGGRAVAQHDAFYVSFPPAKAGSMPPTRISLSPWFPPAYLPTSSDLSCTQLALPYPDDWTASRAGFYLSPAALPGAASEAMWAVSMYAQTQWSQQLQPALVAFDQGRVKGYQLAAWTAHPSLRPALEVDAADHLYLAWLEASGKRDAFVYAASTAPALRDAWDKPTASDWLIELERITIRLLSATGLIFTASVWVVVPVVWIFVALAVLRGTSLAESKGRIIFLGAVVLHWASKYLSTPEVSTRLPHPGYLPLISPLLTLLSPKLALQLAQPASLPAWMGFLVPILSLAVSLIFVHLLYLRWKDEPSSLVAYVLLALADVFISLQVYALTYFDPIKF